jgi:hypothetical protein
MPTRAVEYFIPADGTPGFFSRQEIAANTNLEVGAKATFSISGLARTLTIVGSVYEDREINGELGRHYSLTLQ